MSVLARVHPAVLQARDRFHADTLSEVIRTVEREKVVVVGMAWNPSCGRARRILTENNTPFTYLEYGNYLSGWRRRLAIKLWAGWPTFPMVFIGGALVGGASDLAELKKSGELTRLLA